MTGGVGREQLKEFYRDHFIFRYGYVSHFPSDPTDSQ